MKAARFFVILSVAVALLFAGCLSAPAGAAAPAGASSVETERERAPEAYEIANGAASLALRQYIFARLKTEAFLTADFKSVPAGELAAIVEEALGEWETAAALASGAIELADRAQPILDAQGTRVAASRSRPGAGFVTLAAAAPGRAEAMPAHGGGERIDPKAWAENFTRQFDAIQGNHKISQLAQQLGQDAKSVHEQLQLAQAIIRDEATADAKFWDRMTMAAQATKTACKVGLFVTATVVSGGGSLSALGASSFTLGQAGAVIVGGTDCIVDIGSTGSSIILGENHQVTVRMNDVKDKLAPVSAVVGLLTFNTGEVAEKLSYIGDTLADWIYEGKIMGVKVTSDDKGGTAVEAKLIQAPEKASDEGPALENAGFAAPKEPGMDIAELTEAYGIGAGEALAALENLAEQMDGIAPAAPDESAAPEPTAAPAQGASAGDGALTAQDLVGTYDVGWTVSVQGYTQSWTDTGVCTASGDTVSIQFIDEKTVTHTGTFANGTVEGYLEGEAGSQNFTYRFTRSGGAITGQGTVIVHVSGAKGSIDYEVTFTKTG